MMLKVIETRYAGCHFRSRLEARWAVFFDALTIPWDYEPEGFIFSQGKSQVYYLPDFWLPSLDSWFEVKGQLDASRKALETCFNAGCSGTCNMSCEAVPTDWLLAQHTGKRVFTAMGPMPREVDACGYDLDRDPYDERCRTRGIDRECDVDYAFCACPWCGKIGLEYEARSARVCGWTQHHESYNDALAVVAQQGHGRADDKCYTGNDPRILRAYRMARSARFEYGQSGA